MGKNTKVVSVVEWQSVVVDELPGLRRFVDVRLAERGMTHTAAAERAGISVSRWSHIVNAKEMTETELGHIARGLGMSRERFVRELKGEEEAK